MAFGLFFFSFSLKNLFIVIKSKNKRARDIEEIGERFLIPSCVCDSYKGSLFIGFYT